MKISVHRLPRLWSAALLLSAAGMGAIQNSAQAAERFEISTFKSVRPSLARLVAALQKGDIPGAKAALADYETGRRGIEVYLVARDRSMYTELESNLRVKVTTELNAPKPDLPVLTTDARRLLAKFDEAIAMVQKGAPLDPLYDDVARLRIFRASLRLVDIALRAGDFAAARTGTVAFAAKLDSVKGILKDRSPEALDAVNQGIVQLQTELKAPKPDANKSMKFIAGMMAKYNTVLNQLTAEARVKHPATQK